MVFTFMRTWSWWLFLAPGLYSSFNEMIVDITRFYQTMGFRAQPVEQPTQTTIAGFRAMTSPYVSEDRMGQMFVEHPTPA